MNDREQIARISTIFASTLIDSQSLALLERLRASEPKPEGKILPSLPQTTITLDVLRSIAPVAVGGTLLPYADKYDTHAFTPHELLLAFATEHSIAVADPEPTNAFKFGIRVLPDELDTFVWVHTVTAARVEGTEISSLDARPVRHVNYCDPDTVLGQAEYVAMHCGSVITSLTRRHAEELFDAQKGYSTYYRHVQGTIDYKAAFDGVFYTKVIRLPRRI